MPLLVNLRHLKDKAVDLNGELPVEDLDLCLRDDSVQARHPLQHNLEVQLFGQSVLVQGELKILLDCQCVRCLKPVSFPLELPNWAVHLALEGEEKVPVVSDCVDLTPYVREDILLSLPQHPLCKPDCRGLSAAASRRAKPKTTGAGENGDTPSAWAELDKLTFEKE